MSGNRVIRITILAVMTLAMIGLTAWMFLRPKASADILQEGNRRYAKGLEAYKTKNGPVALQYFQEASLTAKNAIERVTQEVQKTKNPTTEQRDQWVETKARALYLKALALRDQAFAKGLVDGKEIEETADTSTGTTFRRFSAIQDRAAYDDAIGSLRAAAQHLPKDEALQVEALRMEIMHDAVVWTNAQQFAKALVDLKPDDARAHYVLARYEFEQPQVIKKMLMPTPPEKRVRTRVNEALHHVAKVKSAKDYPPGRTLFLEAQIRRWLAKDYDAKGETAKADKERDLLEKLLFDGNTGALAIARSSDGLKNLSAWDMDGFLGMHLLAIDMTTELHRKKGPALEKVKANLADTISYCRRLEKERIGINYPDQIALTLVIALAKTQSALALDNTKEWQQALDATRESLTKALASEKTPPLLVVEFCNLLLREATLAAKANDKIRVEALRKEALARVHEGLASCEKRKVDVKNTYELHQLAAELLLASAGAGHELDSHIRVLVDSKQAEVQAGAHLLRGAILERQGRLDKAREHLEAALKSGNAELTLRANIALPGIYMALGQPNKALVSLQTLDRLYDRFDDLSPHERAWAQQFLRSADDMSVVHAHAYLEAAKQDLASFLTQSPKKPVPAELVQANEKAAEAILQKLPSRGKQALEVRLALINYYGATARFERAEKELAIAVNDHPDSSALLQADIAMGIKKAQDKADGKLSKEEEKELRAGVDKKIEAFTKRFQTDRASRLFWVSWLIRTGRSEQAVTYLKDPVNFPGAKDDVYHRMMALALATSGDKQESAKLLQQLPQDPLVDALLINLAASNEARQKSVQEAMARYVSNGIFRIWEAELKLEDKRYAEAARAFYNALDFTRVRRLAEDGLRRSLLSLADTQPKEAAKVIEEMLAEYPSEPALLLSYAAALMRLDEIGQPTDEWELVKTMGAALNKWERTMTDRNERSANIALTRADLWVRSNQPEYARTEVLRALKQAPDDQATMMLAIRLDLLFGSKAHLADARTYLQQLQKLNPDGANTIVMEALIEDAENQTDKAIERLEKLVERQPQNGDAYRLLVQFSTKQKRRPKALEWSETWLEKMPDNITAAASLVTQLSVADKTPEAARKADEFTQARLKELAKRLEERKLPDEKNPEKSRKETLDEARWILDFSFARAFFQADNLAEAEARYQALLKVRPYSVPALTSLGDVYLKRKDWPQCVKVYEKVLEKEKDNFVAGNNLAWILVTEMKDAKRALELVRSVSKGRYSGKDLPGDRLHPDVLDTLGVIYQHLPDPGPEVHKQMAQTFDAASKRYSRDGRMYLFLGLAYANMKEQVKASSSLTSALALAKDADNPLMSESQREFVVREVEAARKRLKLQ